MLFLRVRPNGTVIYPYNIGRLPKDFPNVSFIYPYETNDLAVYGVYPVAEVSPPAYNRTTSIDALNYIAYMHVGNRQYIGIEPVYETIGETYHCTVLCKRGLHC